MQTEMAGQPQETGRRGRPPRAEATARPYKLRLSPEERARAERAARVNRQKLADFCRDAIVTATEECLE